MSASTSTDTSLVIKRTFNAPRQKVFDAWTLPEHLSNWWRCNPKWGTSVAEVDLQVGGTYRLGMKDPQKEQAFICTGKFLEINAPEKLVYTWTWEPPGMDVSGSTVTVEFIDRGDQTELILTHDKFPSADAAGEHNKGWDGCIAVLAEYVESE